MIAKKTVEGSVSIGEMSMYILAFRQGMTYLKDVFGSLSGLYEDSLFVGDTFEFLDLEENIKAEEPIVKTISFNNKISLENVSFKYPGNNNNIIDNISLEINKGEVVAFVGPNGAGKSTLVRLLCRLYDTTKGEIKWDNINIRSFEPTFYREHLSVIFQDFMLYNMSGEDNIMMGDIGKKPNFDKIIESTSNTGLNHLIDSLPNGYKTVIGTLFDDSRELSWGEWQKLALSRALYREAPLLILDEPSSSLDANTEYEIFSRFREIIKGRTAILISHRFINLSLVDRIFVLDKGKIVESGSHKELLAINGLYRTMYEKQTNRFVLPQ
jgi:ATP-binding cassette subfamily B protein